MRIRRSRAPLQTAHRRALDDDRGSILPLIAGFVALALVLVLLVTAATSLYLERKRLFTLADGAALVGAESFDLDDIAVVDGELRPRLSSVDVAEEVVDYLQEAPLDGLDEIVLERAASDDGVTAVVTLSSYWQPPLLTLFIPEGVRIDVTAEARSVLRR